MSDTQKADEALCRIKDLNSPGVKAALQPYLFLTAMLACAPTEAGKQNIARDIVTAENVARTTDELHGRLTKLTEHYFYNLLLPSIPLVSRLLRRQCVHEEDGLLLRPLIPAGTTRRLTSLLFNPV